MASKKTKSLIFALLPLLIAVLIMTPRLASAQFGFLDDGYILNEVCKIMSGDLSMQLDLEAGRFRPFYWLYFTLIYALAGPNPFWFFFGHLVILLIVLIEIRSLMKHFGAKDWQILLTSLVFLFSIPIIENFYTLSKGETLQIVFLLAALLCLEKLKRASNSQAFWVYSILTFLSILSAILAKETTYIMVPLVAVWVAYVIYQRKGIPLKENRAYLIFGGATLAAVAAYFLIRSLWGAPPASMGTYTGHYAFSLKSLLTRAPRWLTLYAFYFHYLLPLAALALMVLFSKGFNDTHLKRDLFLWGIWVSAWSVGFMPWEYAEVYYLLPFSVGIAVITGLLFPHVLRGIKHGKNFVRWGLTSMAVLFLGMFLASLTHYRTHALVQLTFDQVNGEMLEYTQTILPEEGDLIVGVNTYNEYVQNISHFLVDQERMTGITIDYVSLEVLLQIQSRSDAIVLLPFIQNQPGLLLRAGVEEEFTMAWVEEILQELDGSFLSLEKFQDGFRINNINLPVLACPILGSRGYCTNPDPFIDTRVFQFGWDVLKIQ